MAQHFDFPHHFLVVLLKSSNEIDRYEGNGVNQMNYGNLNHISFTFTEDLPLACFHPSVSWKLVTKFIKQLFHFFTSLSFCELV